MKTTHAVLLAALLALPAATLAQEEPAGPAELEQKAQEIFLRGTIAEREMLWRDAAKAYREYLDLVPEVGERTGEVHLRLANALVRLGHVERALDLLRETARRFEGHERIVVLAKKAFEDIERRFAEHERREAERRELEARLRELERAVAEGEGERERRERELRRADREARELEERRRLYEFLGEKGLPEEEIEEHVRRHHEARERLERAVEALHEAEAAMRREPHDPDRRARLHEARREVEEARLALHGRPDRERDRREFVELAERLGIPAEQAERFLREHSRAGRADRKLRGRRGESPGPGPRGGRGGAGGGPRLEEIVERIEHALGGIERRFADLEERIERIERRLDR